MSPYADPIIGAKCLDFIFDDSGFEKAKSMLPPESMESVENLLRYLVHHPDAWMELSLWRGTLRSDAYALALSAGLQRTKSIEESQNE